MRSLLITLTGCSAALLLSGCPDLPGHGAAHAGHEEDAARPPHDGPAQAAVPDHQAVSEIAWFQGTIDEAFSHRGCSESRQRRTLFRF